MCLCALVSSYDTLRMFHCDRVFSCCVCVQVRALCVLCMNCTSQCSIQFTNHYRTHQPTYSSWTCLAYNIPAQTAQKTPFLCCSAVVAVETSLFAEPLIGSGCCIVAYCNRTFASPYATRADEGRGDSPLHPHVAYLAAAAGIELTHAASGSTRLHRFHFGVAGNVFVGISGSVGRQRTLDVVREVGICGRGEIWRR
jgi:hypothetical protein